MKFRRPRLRKHPLERPRLPRTKMLTALRRKARGGVEKILQLKLPRLNMTLPQVKIPTVILPALNYPKFEWPKLKEWKPAIDIQTIRTITFVTICVCFLILLGGGANIGVSATGFAPMGFVKNAQTSNMAEKESTDGNSEFFNSIVPAAGQEAKDGDYRYTIEEDTLDIESVLIPRETTVISSSRDSKIKAINFDNGEIFKAGDILVEYACDDARAEVQIAQTQKELAAQKKTTSHRLFKLDIISNLEKMELESEDKQAEARTALHKSRMKNCFIRAEYDGRVVKRLANSGEFTRTDRVLMEVASLGHLKAEFLLPSRWLRWVNIGAPISITINETDEIYTATIQHIYGEVDPASQSIQITAQLEPYEDPLLPGMSGQATIDVRAIRQAGIGGFLERRPEN